MSTTETAPPPPAAPRRGVNYWLWLLVLIVVSPALYLLYGEVKSPPRAARVPAGRIVYLEPDQVSERTTALRSLRVTLPGGGSRELLHEQESLAESGPREWIFQPACSPDGKWVAFVKQLITIQEETHTNITQIWAIPVDAPNAKPHLLMDLSGWKLKPIVGLAWTPDSRNVVFLEDATEYQIAAYGKANLRETPLPHCPPLKTTPELSATRSPTVGADGAVSFRSVTAGGSVSPVPSAVSPDGKTVATAEGQSIRLSPPSRVYPVRWGWSLFGNRKITSLRWSPDGRFNGRFIGFTVSKPPVPEDELFYLDLATGKTYQLPFRTGRAAWDWAR